MTAGFFDVALPGRDKQAGRSTWAGRSDTMRRKETTARLGGPVPECARRRHVSTEDNKALVRRYIETWNRGDLKGMAEFWAPDMVHHTRTGSHGFEAVVTIVSDFMKAFPDLQFEIDDLVADGDR